MPAACGGDRDQDALHRILGCPTCLPLSLLPTFMPFPTLAFPPIPSLDGCVLPALAWPSTPSSFPPYLAYSVSLPTTTYLPHLPLPFPHFPTVPVPTLYPLPPCCVCLTIPWCQSYLPHCLCPKTTTLLLPALDLPVGRFSPPHHTCSHLPPLMPHTLLHFACRATHFVDHSLLLPPFTLYPACLQMEIPCLTYLLGGGGRRGRLCVLYSFPALLPLLLYPHLFIYHCPLPTLPHLYTPHYYLFTLPVTCLPAQLAGPLPLLLFPILPGTLVYCPALPCPCPLTCIAGGDPTIFVFPFAPFAYCLEALPSYHPLLPPPP